MTTTTTRRQQLEAAAAQGAADYQAGTYDPFANIPGADNHDDLWPADLVMDTARVDENGSSVVTRAATVADLVDADEEDGDDPDEWRDNADPGFVRAPTQTVRDNAGYAWRNRSREVDEQVFASLPADLVNDYRDALDAAAVAALDGRDGVLVEVWRERGYVMLGCTQQAMGDLDRGLPDELYHEVWDMAANRLDGHALAEAAGLGQELLDYQDTHDSDRDYED